MAQRRPRKTNRAQRETGGADGTGEIFAFVSVVGSEGSVAIVTRRDGRWPQVGNRGLRKEVVNTAVVTTGYSVILDISETKLGSTGELGILCRFGTRCWALGWYQVAITENSHCCRLPENRNSDLNFPLHSLFWSIVEPN